MVIKNDAFYNETIVNSLITETVEAVAHGNTKAATKLKSVIDAVFTDKAKADTIFYKQDNGNSINYLWQIAVVSNILATRMEAELTDIVAFILEASLLSDLHHPNYIYKESKKNIDISQLFGHNFKKHIDSNAEENTAYFKRCQKSSESNSAVNLFIDKIRDDIMNNVVERFGNGLVDQVGNYNDGENKLLIKAFNFAKDAHKGQYRKSGEAYIMHPIKVAKILADECMNENVIAAALLHDVAEDTDFTISDIRKNTNREVASLVEAVTQIKAATNASVEDKEETDEKTFGKLCALVTKSNDYYMRYALHIKAADRIHNLSTIFCFNGEKQFNKVDETTKMYLRLFKEFGLHKFVAVIENLCFRISNEESYNQISLGYQKLVSENKESSENINAALKSVCELLNTVIQENYDQAKLSGFNFEIQNRLLLPREVLALIQEQAKQLDYNKIFRYITKQYVHLENIYIILDSLDGRSNLRHFENAFIMAHNYIGSDIFKNNNIIIKNINYSANYRYVEMVLEDEYQSTVKVKCFMRDDFNNYCLGSPELVIEKEIIEIDDLEEKIMVYDRSGKEIYLPKGSTVIDFAFVINPNFGKTLYACKINNKNANITTTLSDGYNVIVYSHYEKTGVLNGNETMQIEWLNHAKTNLARKTITKHIKKQFAELQNKIIELEGK